MKDTKLKSIIQTTLFTSGVSPPVKKLHKCRDRSVTGSFHTKSCIFTSPSLQLPIHLSFITAMGEEQGKAAAFEGYMKLD